MKSLTSIAILLLSSSLVPAPASAHASAEATPRGRTEAEVKQDTIRAICDGSMPGSDLGLTLKQVYPQHYPLKTAECVRATSTVSGASDGPRGDARH